MNSEKNLNGINLIRKITSYKDVTDQLFAALSIETEGKNAGKIITVWRKK